MGTNSSNSNNVIARTLTQILSGTVLLAALAVLFFIIKITISYF